MVIGSDIDERGQGSSDRPSTVDSASGLLIPPKQKLAPIASCETLSDRDPHAEDTDQSEESSGESPDDTYTAAITITTSSVPRVSRSHGCSPRNLMVTFGDEFGESSTDDIRFEDDNSPPHYEHTLTVPTIGGRLATGGSSDTLIGSANGNYSNILSNSNSSDTLVAISPRTSPIPLVTQLSAPTKQPTITALKVLKSKKISAPPIKIPTSHQLEALALSPASSPKFRGSSYSSPSGTSASQSGIFAGLTSPGLRRATSPCASPPVLARPGSPSSPKTKRVPSPISYSFSSPNIIANKTRQGNAIDTRTLNLHLVHSTHSGGTSITQ